MNLVPLFLSFFRFFSVCLFFFFPFIYDVVIFRCHTTPEPRNLMVLLIIRELSRETNNKKRAFNRSKSIKYLQIIK